MAALTVRLLGSFEARLDAGPPIQFPTRKARALLAYLAFRPGRAHSRGEVADLLWSTRDDEQARGSLRRTLSDLRKSLGDPEWLVTDGDMLTLGPESVAVDVAAFERLANDSAPAALEDAAALYKAELLAGFGLPEQPFEEWLRAERERLRDLVLRALARLLAHHEASGASERAIETAHRLLAIDPVSEATHRTLMSLYAQQGRRSEALRQYERCRNLLREMLGIAPDPATEELHRALQKPGAASDPTMRAPPEQRGEPGSLPDRPSIAVLPFKNMSGDPEQEFFADGLTEDIIAALSHISALWVIASASTFTYKGKAVDVRQVNRELGVRYLIEGSVRKAGDRVRIASQLIDATTGTHIWADHFDGALSDIFDLQDRITANVVGAIEPKLRSAEIERAKRKPTQSFDAYDLFLRAVALNATRKKEDNKEALQLLYRAIEIDRRYAAAYALAGYCYLRQKVQGWVSLSAPAVAEGIRMARLAAENGQDDPEALWMAGVTMAFLAGDVEGGLALIERSLALNPNSANGLMASGLVRAWTGDTDTAIAHLQRSRHLSPLDPIAYGTYLGFVNAHFVAGRYEEASAWCDRVLNEAPTYFPPALHFKIACCGLLGRLEEGRKWTERLLAVNPDASVSGLQTWYQLFIKKPQVLEAFLTGLRKSGLPE